MPLPDLPPPRELLERHLPPGGWWRRRWGPLPAWLWLTAGVLAFGLVGTCAGGEPASPDGAVAAVPTVTLAP